MKKIIFTLFCYLLAPGFAFAQSQTLPQNILFDDSDIIVRAEPTTEEVKITDEDKNKASSSARALLKSAPRKITPQDTSSFKSLSKPKTKAPTKPTFAAPFGMLWNSSISSTRNQGIQLNMVDLKDYPNSFEATRLPKAIDFFDHVYVSFGHSDELYRIIAYSIKIDDDASASKTLDYYRTYSEYLDKKYGNMKQEFTPATITKIIKDDQDKEQEIEEQAPLGNPEFLSQLESGQAVLYSTYHNDNIEATLSISVDGDKKSYITIEYLNMQILKQNENQTIDAL